MWYSSSNVFIDLLLMQELDQPGGHVWDQMQNKYLAMNLTKFCEFL